MSSDFGLRSWREWSGLAAYASLLNVSGFFELFGLQSEPVHGDKKNCQAEDQGTAKLQQSVSARTCPLTPSWTVTVLLLLNAFTYVYIFIIFFLFLFDRLHFLTTSAVYLWTVATGDSFNHVTFYSCFMFVPAGETRTWVDFPFIYFRADGSGRTGELGKMFWQ